MSISAGLPMTLLSGETVGSLVIVDYRRHEFGDEHMQRPGDLAADLVRLVGTTPAFDDE